MLSLHGGMSSFPRVRVDAGAHDVAAAYAGVSGILCVADVRVAASVLALQIESIAAVISEAPFSAHVQHRHGNLQRPVPRIFY